MEATDRVRLVHEGQEMTRDARAGQLHIQRLNATPNPEGQIDIILTIIRGMVDHLGTKVKGWLTQKMEFSSYLKKQ